MTRKTATLWKQNPSKNAGAVQYSSSSVQYNSTTTRYSSSTVALAEDNKLPSSWTKQSKSLAGWSFNPLANTNLYLYDSATYVYDSATQTYDGVVTGQDFSDQKTPAVWSEA